MAMRTKNSFEYGDDAKAYVERFVTEVPQTTYAITLNIKDKAFSKIHRITVLRILRQLKEEGSIRGRKKGRLYLWYK